VKSQGFCFCLQKLFLVKILFSGQDPAMGLARQSLEMMAMEQLHASF